MDDDEEYLDDQEDWSDNDDDNDDESIELLPCPECGSQVYEEAEQCPYCGAFIVHSNSVWKGRPFWWLVIGGAGVLTTLLALTTSC